MVTKGHDERKLGPWGKGAGSQGRLLGGSTGVGALCGKLSIYEKRKPT